MAEKTMDQREEASLLDESLAAVDALRGALEGAGIVLPSLRVDVGPVFGCYALVDLGPCTPDTARKLADVIRRGATAPPPDPRGAEHLGGLASLLRGHGYTADVVDGRLQATDGPDPWGVVVECRERPDDDNRLWLAWAEGVSWICEADHPTDALVTVKAALRGRHVSL